MFLPKNHELLVHAAFSAISGPGQEREYPSLDTVNGEVIEQAALLAKEHRLSPILYRYLNRRGIDLPSGLKNAAHQSQIRSLHYLRELQRLQKSFEQEDISWISLKGPVLSLQLYGDPSFRTSKDLDIWVDEDRYFDACQTMLNLGYVCPTPGKLEALRHSFRCSARNFQGKDLTFVHQDQSIHVELHWRLKNEGAHLPDWSEAWAEREMQLAGDCQFPRLSRTHTLLYLCRHGQGHYWGRLQWLVDVARLLAISNGTDLEKYLLAAESKGRTVSVRTAFQLIDRIWGMDAISPGLGRSQSMHCWIRERTLRSAIITRLSKHFIGTCSIHEKDGLILLRRLYANLEHETLSQRISGLHHWVMTRSEWLTKRWAHPWFVVVILSYVFYPFLVILRLFHPKRWVFRHNFGLRSIK